MRSIQSRRAVGILVVTLTMLLTLVVAAPVAAKKNPPGDNGTIKVDGVEFDRHPNNEPHVDCVFEIDWYGFDEGDLWAEVWFEAHPPTGRGLLLHDRVFIGQDDNSGGGSEAGWDASKVYDLTSALASYPVHAQQGYHVKLTIEADGSQGAKTKHKVFWVGPCEDEAPPSNPPSNPPGGGTGGGSGSQPPVRSGTQGGSGGPTVTLPDTAMDAALAATLSLLAGTVLLGSSVTMVAVVVSRSRSRRR